MNKYNDIINLPHHISDKRPQMDMYKRGAQFSPFAALTGYDEAIIETSRLTDKKIDIDDSLKNIINGKLNIINKNILKHPNIEIIYFMKDAKKDGGNYITYSGKVKGIDTINQVIYFYDNIKIKFDDILSIKSEIINDKLC